MCSPVPSLSPDLVVLEDELELECLVYCKERRFRAGEQGHAIAGIPNFECL
jgi:hypothetical protein